MKIYLVSGQVYNATILQKLLFFNLIPRSSPIKGEWEVGREQERIKTRESDGAYGSERVTEDLSPGPQEKNSIDPGKIPWSFIQENFSLQDCRIRVSEKNRANGPQGTHSSPVSFKAAAPIGLRANSSLQSTDWFSSHSNGHSAYKEASVCDQQSHPVKTGRMNRCSWLRGPWYTTPDPARSPLLPEN